MLILMISSFLIFSCKKENLKLDTKEETSHKTLKKDAFKKEIDTSKVGILVFKKNKTKEDQFLMLKNAAFCLCTNHENQEIINSNNSVNYKLIPDKSLVSYAEQSGLDIDLFYKNKRLDELVIDWSKKQYNTKPKEETSDSKSFIIQMKCFDFFNSKTLNNYIDSLKSVY